MFGWTTRKFFPFTPVFIPHIWRSSSFSPHVFPKLLLCCSGLLFTFCISLILRLLEIPFWDNATYQVDGEYLLATHDAYHWLAGANGFGLGVEHPMAKLVLFTAHFTYTSVATVAFWLPPFLASLVAVVVFLWGWGLGFPFAGMCAGILTTLSPVFLARTLLGFYDTDLILLLFSVALGLLPALWLTPWLISPIELLLQVKQTITKVLLSQKKKTTTEDLKAHLQQQSIEHATVPLEYSTHAKQNPEHTPVVIDTVVEPVEQPIEKTKNSVTTLIPQSFLKDFLFYIFSYSPVKLSLPDNTYAIRKSIFSWQGIVLLLIAGLLGNWTQSWHSFFPYFVRYSALITFLLIIFLTTKNTRRYLLQASLCYVLPLLFGFFGLLMALLWYFFLFMFSRVFAQEEALSLHLSKKISLQKSSESMPLRMVMLLLLALLWGSVFFAIFDAYIGGQMVQSFLSYAKRSGDIISQADSVRTPLVFPAVTESIIETQQISFQEVFTYIYPKTFITWLSFFFFIILLFCIPALCWLLPLAVLTLLSIKMGGRMAMFGCPAFMLALCIGGALCLEGAFKLFNYYIHKKSYKNTNTLPLARPILHNLLRLSTMLVALFVLAQPLVILLPKFFQGPIISQEHVKALQFIKKETPENSIIWNWWDWGYATHYFAKRNAIADGARHGGASLYLPAAVYATSNPRFARQLIKETAAHDNLAHEVFHKLSTNEAEKMLAHLQNEKTPLISANGKQYLVVSFDHLPLMFWIYKHGSWNFKTKTGTDAHINNIAPALQFHLDSGKIIPTGGTPIQAKTITLLTSDKRKRNIYPVGNHHFIFKIKDSAKEASNMPLPTAWAYNFWQIVQPSALEQPTPHKKLVADPSCYYSLMIQLLLCEPNDPRFTPYFKLAYDNIYARVYEVL